MAGKSRKAVVLVSGGLDSVCALYETVLSLREVVGLSFDYGAKHNHREIPCATRHCQWLGVEHQIICLDFIGESFKSNLLKGGGPIPHGHYQDESMRQTVVPFRNGIMLAVAAGYAESIGAQELVIAAHAGDHAIYPDCREEFMRAMGSAVHLGTYSQVKIIRPFIRLTKAEIVQHGHDLGVGFSKTWSCYEGGAIHCGKCGACVERREAFVLAGVEDPTTYRECCKQRKE